MTVNTCLVCSLISASYNALDGLLTFYEIVLGNKAPVNIYRVQVRRGRRSANTIKY